MDEREDKPEKYDLLERSACFGEKAIGFAKLIPVSSVTSSLINQLVRAATSIGANYAEADDAESKKDFRHKIGICRKESKECKHWVRMIVAAVPELRDEGRPIWPDFWRDSPQQRISLLDIRIFFIGI